MELCALPAAIYDAYVQVFPRQPDCDVGIADGASGESSLENGEEAETETCLCAGGGRQMKTLKYQDRAVDRLVDLSMRMLCYPQDCQNLVFKAPTGSGKTVMATRLLANLHEALLAQGRPDAAFVWIAPQKLRLQSFIKQKKLFASSRRLASMLCDDIDQSEGIIKSGEILFVNWESVNRDSNVMARERKNAESFFQIIDRTRLEEHRPIYLIVDEEHRNWSKNADRSSGLELT